MPVLNKKLLLSLESTQLLAARNDEKQFEKPGCLKVVVINFQRKNISMLMEWNYNLYMRWVQEVS